MKNILLPATCIIVSCISANAQNIKTKTLHDYITSAPFAMPLFEVPKFAEKQFIITDFGAVGDGHTLNTAAFAKAIKACTDAGGGKVIVPPGSWLTGPIELKSNINLHVEKGGYILFTPDRSQYPMIKPSPASTSFTAASPIYGYDLTNIAISGEGIIDGSGEAWRPIKKSKVNASEWKSLVSSGGVVSKDGEIWWPSKEAMNGEEFLSSMKTGNTKPTAEDYLPARDFLRPYMLYLVNCKNVLVEDITLRNSPKFVFYPNHCTNMVIRNASILNEYNAQNGDGIDISACKNVVIYNCTLSVGDDGICMKSSRSKNDNISDFQLENIVIADNVVYHAHGGFVIGSNTDGNMRNIYVSNCNFIGTDIGLRFKSNAGRGGVVKDIFIKDIYMSNILNEAISFDTYYEDMPAGKTADSIRTVLRDKTPEFKNISISNVYCTGAKTAIAIKGLPEMPVHDIKFSDIIISSKQGVQTSEASNLTFNNAIFLPAKEPVYALTSSKNFIISDIGNNAYKTFLSANGKVLNITISGKNASVAKNAIHLENGINASEVIIK